MRISDWSSDVCSSDLICYKQRRATRPIVAAFEHDALPKDAAPAGCDAFGTPGGLRHIAIDFGLRVAINSPERVGSHWIERANGVAEIYNRFDDKVNRKSVLEGKSV